MPEDEVRDPAGGSDFPESLQERLAAKEAEAADYLATLQRLKADFENYRRRMGQEQSRWQEQGVADLAKALLPAIDNLERALQSGGDAASEGFRRGVEMTLQQFEEILERADIVRIAAAGRPFDPNLHEAMVQEDSSEHEDNEIMEVFQSGWRLKDRVIRPALVKVARRVETPTAGAVDDASKEASDNG